MSLGQKLRPQRRDHYADRSCQGDGDRECCSSPGPNGSRHGRAVSTMQNPGK